MLLKKIKIALATLAITIPVAVSAQTSAEEVKSLIHKVNKAWQDSHKPQVRSFWDEAAYHAGNMEAFRLTGEMEYANYSLAWAEHNKWQGATGTDKSRWKMTYGEKPDYVLFGDWQCCFQTYADLYELQPDKKRIARAREVMEYQMSTARHDYWWWADGLFMVMPVMTKMARLTDNPKYMEKLFEYYQFADSLMFSPEDGLYFRDAKYVYPAHTTAAGKKDFWARGNGWALAALAKIIPDMPDSYAHKDFFVTRYKALAAAVKNCQQKEGHWTRSMLDPAQSPGFETSGTAFFTFGLLWGIDNGLLPEKEYMPAVEKAWKYLTKTALQPDGSVGYVQPIGERAIPGQTVDAKSTANFGVGAFLLAACQWVRHQEMNSNGDRAYWVELLRQMAEPVLSNMAKGKLQENMEVEVSPTWDGRDKKVTYMEAFGRLMAGISPWLALPDDNTAEGKLRKKLRDYALDSYKNAVDPNSPDYLLWRKEGQPLVDAAYIAESFLRAWDALWVPLDNETKARYIEEFTQLRRVDPPYTNWLLFSATIETVLHKAGAQADIYRINSCIRKMEEWYVGDGWYADGPVFAFNYYNSYVFHPMYLDVLENCAKSRMRTRIDYWGHYKLSLERAQKYGIILERLISPEGTFPAFGRSIPYRMAAMQPLAMLSLQQKLPATLTNGQVRAALTKTLHSMFDGKENFNSKGFLTIGFCGRQPNIADPYTNNGSLYMNSLVLLPLGLPASHPFWTDGAQPWTQMKAWSGMDFPKDHHWTDHIQPKDRL